MNQQERMYTIAQLRQDKIIYAVEATATDVLMVLCFMFVSTYMNGSLAFVLHLLLLLVGVGYTVFMGIGNYGRLQRIKSLERMLQEK